MLVAARGSDDDDLAPRPDAILDLTWNHGDITRSVRNAINRMGGLDWLVLSAGYAAYHRGFPDEGMLKHLDVNFIGRVHAYRAALPALMESKGKALMISSTVASHGCPGLSIYAASLGAVNSFTISEGIRARKRDVQLNALAPGWTNSEMTAELREDYREAAERWMPIGRFLEPHEVAAKAERVLLEDHFGEVIEYLGEDLL